VAGGTGGGRGHRSSSASSDSAGSGGGVGAGGGADRDLGGRGGDEHPGRGGRHVADDPLVSHGVAAVLADGDHGVVGQDLALASGGAVVEEDGGAVVDGDPQ